jgi:hypothetical protein
MKALGGVQEFNPTVINNYIASRQGDSVIIDGKSTVRDGFIPFITTPKQTSSPLVFDNIVIDQAADSDVLQAMQAGHTTGLQDPVFNIPQDARPHGTVFTTNSTYTSSMGFFKAGNAPSGQVVDPNTVYIYLAQGMPGWQGYFAIGGNPKYRDAPDLMQDFQFN